MRIWRLSAADRLLTRILGTLGTCALIWWALQHPDRGMLREITAFGPMVAVLVAGVFFALVLAYARDLHRVLSAVPVAFRAASPASVWWMLVIPCNFTEDFFIIDSIAGSLRNTATARPDLAPTLGHFGQYSGMGWCGLQIVSLVPHDIGSLAGVLALPLWLWHWHFVRKARRALTQSA